jgi:hypothetical protein
MNPEDDPLLKHDVGTGETIPADAAEKLVKDARAALEAALYRAADEAAEECKGKSENEIREILQRKLGAVFLLHGQPLPPQPRN